MEAEEAGKAAGTAASDTTDPAARSPPAVLVWADGRGGGPRREAKKSTSTARVMPMQRGRITAPRPLPPELSSLPRCAVEPRGLKTFRMKNIV